MERPESWGNSYELPARPESDYEEILNDLVSDLFHMPDDEAEKIKYQYVLKYTFLDKKNIINL